MQLFKIISNYVAYFSKNQIQKMNFRKISVAFLIGISVLFLIVTLIITLFSLQEFEAILTKDLQEERNPALDFYMITVSLFGENEIAIPMIIGTSMLFFIFKYRLEALFLLLSSLGSILNFGLKLWIDRPRPTADMVEKITEASHQSFPSGHTVHYVVFFGMLLVFVLKIKPIPVWAKVTISILCLVLIFSVPFSRVYLGAHWASDVIAGFFFGILVLSGLLYFYFKLQEKGFLQKKAYFSIL